MTDQRDKMNDTAEKSEIVISDTDFLSSFCGEINLEL